MRARRNNFPKKNSNKPEYEIKTYGSSNKLNRSPIVTNTNTRYYKQNALKIDNGNNSNYGEMDYIEPGGEDFSSNIQMKKSQFKNYTIRSPIKNYGNKENSNLNTNDILDNSLPMNFSNYNFNHPPLTSFDNRRERLSRSPKTINIGETAQEAEYNLRTINGGHSPKRENYTQEENDNPIIEHTYNMINSEAGNIFLDHPLQNSFIKNQDAIDTRGSFDTKDFPVREAMSNSRFDNNIIGKMSPKINIEGDSDSNSNLGKNENSNTQIKDLKSQLERRQNIETRNEDGLVEGTKPIKNELEKIEDMVKNQEMKTRDNITEQEVKRLVDLYVKNNDPKKDGEGRLISNKQTVVTSIKEDLFSDRYKVLQKMNKLSNILLSSKKTQNAYEINTLNKNTVEGKTFDRNTLNNTNLTKKLTFRGKYNKFHIASLAMLAKEKNIFRRNRIGGKGGVVDLAQESFKKNNKFKIKNFKLLNRGKNMINPKYKEKAARIVQGWWRDQKAKYKHLQEQIVKIQSVWRGKFIRKYVYDIIYLTYLHSQFFEVMEKTLVNHVRPKIWDELFSRTKLAKSTMKKLLEKNNNRYNLLRLKPYFHKWKIIANFLKKRILKSKTLVIKKGDVEQKRVILKEYFKKWNLKSNLYKYMGKTKKANEKRKKFLGAYEMLNGLKQHTKKVAMEQVGIPIKQYLQEIYKKKIMKNIILSKTTRNINIKKREILRRWKDAVHKGKYDNLKANIFSQNINHIDSRMDKIKLKYYLQKWRRHVPTAKKMEKIQKGMELLKSFTIRNTYIEPLNAFKEKIEEKDEHNKMASLFVIKRRKIRDDLRTCINKWKEKTLQINNKNDRYNIYSNLLKNLLNNIENRILYKRFNKWRQRPKVDINKEFSKMRQFTDILSNIFKNNVRADKYDFLDNLETTRADRAILNSTKKLFKNYKKRERRIVRHYLYKWRSQTKNSEITELQNQLLKLLFISKEGRNNQLKLAKYMARWRLFTSDKKHYDNIEKLKQVLKGGDILGNLKSRRQRDFIIRLYRKMGSDYRPLILNKLTTKLEKPRSGLRECLARWRRINEKLKGIEAIKTISTLKGKFIYNNAKNVNIRSKRDDLMKAFFKWKNLCRKPEEYYPKITRGFEILRKLNRRNLCQEPFDLISKARNFERRLQKIFKNYENQNNRLLNGKLRNLFGRWRLKVSQKNEKDLKTNLIYKTKNNLENNLRIKTLAKYFTRWKLYRRKGLDVNFSKGINILTNLYRKPFYNDILESYLNKVEQISKLKGANNLVKATDRYSKVLLRNAFIKMYKGAISIDPNRMKKIKTRLRRIIKHNEEEPRSKAFHRWANQIKLMKFREKDLEKARVMIGNTLRNNYRMNLNIAMSRWKKKIQQMREQYLKCLLMKQIKSTQIMKEKMNNQTKLRAALLRWRSSLAPINYLERIKRIKKGCKLFKRGLKKRDERQIFDGVEQLAKYNRKIYLLKQIINVTNPNLDKYKMKECIDVWKNKLGDTQKMKNKMNTLLDDYLYSDKIHDEMIKAPANLILNAMKNYNEMKIEKANKINEFAKGVLLAKENLNKLKLTLKLRNIVNKKEKDNNYIKGMNLRRFHRNAQKIKNKINARFIQRFIKRKLRKYLDKKKLIANGAGIFEKYVKKCCLNNIKDKAKQNSINRILVSSINKQENQKDDVLKNILNKWKNIIPKIKENEAAIKLQNLFRNYKSRQKLLNLEKRQEILYDLHNKYETKNQKILHSNFRDWLNRALMTKNSENAKNIQRFLRRKMLFNKLKVAQEKLRNLFVKGTKNQLVKVMERSSRIIGGKGEVVYKAVQDILYRNPFENFIEKLKFTGKVNTLRNIQPKVHDILRNYYLPKTLKKWKLNTYDQTVKYTKEIQNFLRMQYQKKLIRDKLRLNELLKGIVSKKQKNNLYKLQLPFSIWHKKIIMDKANESVKLIQNRFRTYISTKHAQEALAKNKLQKLVRANQLKNILDKIKDAGNNKILKENRKTSLINLIEKKAESDDKSLLEKCLNKWKNYNNYANKCTSKIGNAFKRYLVMKEINRRKRIDKILKKCINKHNKVDNDKMRTKLRKWNNKTKMIRYNIYTIKIQRFMRPKLTKIRNDKFKKYFNDNGKKKFLDLLLKASKVNRIKKSLERNSLQRFMDNLKLTSLKSNQKEKLGNLIDNKDTKTNEMLKIKYLTRWSDQNMKIKNAMNNSATKLQNNFRAYLARKKVKNAIFIKNVLEKNILQKTKVNSNKIFSFFQRWRNTVKNLTLNKNATIIQKFCNKILRKVNYEKALSRKIRLNTFVNRLFTIKYGAKYAIQKIKNKRDEVTFIKFNNTLKEKRKNTLKSVFDKIKSTAFNNKLKGALEVPNQFNSRILKKCILRWMENSNKLAEKRAAEILQKNVRLYLQQKKQENKKQILSHLLLKLSEKNSNIKYKYFNRMHTKANQMTKLINKHKIAKFIKNQYKTREAAQKWKNLGQKYFLNNRNDNISEVIENIKKYKAINKMKDPFIHKARVSIIQLFKDKIRKNQIVVLLKKMLPERNDKNGHDTILKYIGRWKLNAGKLRERQNKLEKALKEIEKRNIIQAANKIKAAMLIKKLFTSIPKIRGKLFLNKLKKIKVNKTKYDNLKDNISKIKQNLLLQEKEKVMNKLYKLYVNHKINNLFNKLEYNLKNKVKPLYGKEFIKKLYENKKEKAKYNYGDQIKSINKAQTTKFSFKNRIKSQNPKDIIKDNSAPLKKCLPHIIKFLQNKLDNRRKDALNSIKEHNKKIKFAELLSKFSNKIISKPKKEIVDVISREAKYTESRPICQAKLFKLLRKKYIKHLLLSLEEPAKIYNLYYLINITSMHKVISKQRFNRELIRKWRFAAFAKKMARKKMELMYKNLHASYLQMADEFFGEDNVNPSVIKEFEMFGNNVGMFTGETPEVGEELNKKYYKTIEKKYSFANGQEKKETKGKIIIKKKESEEEYIKGDDIKNKDKYKYKKTEKDYFKKYKKK